MTRKQRLFIEYYIDRGSKGTYGNATQSAISAGYSVKSAGKIGFDLLKKPTISQKITELKAKIDAQYCATREQKIKIAWENYLNAKTPGEKKFWFKEHGELQGDYVTKTINKSEIAVEQKQHLEEIAMKTYNRMQSEN